MISGGTELTEVMLESIRQVECLLPGQATAEGADLRWQAIITLEPLIHSAPEELWPFIARWGSHPDKDLRMAIATCLLEHLLESHFATYFPRVEVLAKTTPLFGETLQFCWRLGQAQLPENKERYTTLCHQLQQRNRALIMLIPAANGHLSLEFDDSPEALWEEVIAHLLTEGFVRDGVEVLGLGQSIFPGFVREGIALAAGWDEWSGNYLLATCEDGDAFLQQLHVRFVESYRVK